MDPDSCINSEKQEQNSDNMPNAGHLFSSIGVRCTIFTNNELDKFLLDYGFNFLPVVSIVSWILFLFI